MCLMSCWLPICAPIAQSLSIDDTTHLHLEDLVGCNPVQVQVLFPALLVIYLARDDWRMTPFIDSSFA